MDAVVAPWRSVLTDTEHALILFGIVVAGFALLAGLVRTWAVRGEVSGRFRPAISASLAVLSVATTSYLVLATSFLTGYKAVGQDWVPLRAAELAWSARYLDWAVTVPLLFVELVAVSNLAGRRLQRVRATGVAGAFLMIAAGYIGGVAVDGGRSFTALLTWGLISSVFFVVLYALVLTTVLRSLAALPSVARPTYRTAMIVLMATWFVYPIVFGLQGFTRGGAWAVTGQLLLCAADVIAKVGFGILIHKIAKLRTVFDVLTGIDAHPETLWVDGTRASEAMLPRSDGIPHTPDDVRAAEGALRSPDRSLR